ncbi:hypothetical protein [Citrobacter phage CVT22]|uniref:Uncharacterized protein n=1 Tax=Citrobacter phage CVT22 TaxID=1622234 RepID=A0A0R6AS86_9CAUD|nr:hypothetical protein APL39_gp55 [Citrobacter phage CVT22]AJT60759.1 hypothetical protein [Citrobacter phage CVT22]
MCKIKVGDLVTPSHIAKRQRWWRDNAFSYMLGGEFMVIKVEKGVSINENVVYFHDPILGARRWRESYLDVVSPFSLENE